LQYIEVVTLKVEKKLERNKKTTYLEAPKHWKWNFFCETSFSRKWYNIL